MSTFFVLLVLLAFPPLYFLVRPASSYFPILKHTRHTLWKKSRMFRYRVWRRFIYCTYGVIWTCLIYIRYIVPEQKMRAELLHKTSHMTDLQYCLCVLVFTVILMSTLNALYSIGDYENLKNSAVHILDQYPIQHDGIEESIRSLYVVMLNKYPALSRLENKNI